eukprot:jgi/Mesen1/1894/ME000143S00948
MGGLGACSLVGIEHSQNLEVINPEGGETDAEEEAKHSRFKKEEQESYFKMMHKYVGADVTSLVTLPVIIFEPMTMLQKMAELMEYTDLLIKADMAEDPAMQMVYSTAWAISVYFAYQRTWKPFNPILGETYELTNHNGIHFVGEQVSHHPPMSAGHAESEHFTYDVTSKLKTKFLGNSLDVYPVGRTRVVLKRTGHVLDLVPPPTKVHNLIFGRTWVDSPGDMVLTNTTTGDKVVLYFQPCGWFGLSCQPCDAEGEPLKGSQLQEYTHFAHKLNDFATAPRGLLPSDSRLRPDRLALERGDLHKAGVEKTRLEERQRAEKKEREAKGLPFVPRWFEMSGEVAHTPWAELEVLKFKESDFKQHRDVVEKNAPPPADPDSLEFSPWQFDHVHVPTSEPEATAGLVVNKSD